jgi:8-hydroxy-5-deazaflavin:NADPH oxidoreductase
MKVGIIGSGNMGRTLGLLWLERGHDVFFGSRNEQDIAYIKKVYPGPLQHGTIREAILFGDVLLYSLRDTLPSSAAPRDLWEGKIIIDCNNGTVPPDFNYPTPSVSYTEKYQQDIPGSKVVKAFNTSAQELFDHPSEVIRHSGAIGFMAGNDEAAKQTVAVLLRDSGLTPIDAGLAYNAKQLEAFADLVRLLMIRNGLGAYLVFSAHSLPAAADSSKGERQPTRYA